MVTALLNNYRQSPRKVRLVATLLSGKSVTEALVMLQFVSKRASGPISTLINSAVANAKNNFSLDKENLFIKELRVDSGPVLKRRMPRARGRAFPIHKRTSHVRLVLAEKVGGTNKKSIKALKSSTKAVKAAPAKAVKAPKAEAKK
jgi:large subunit ribosomal protein L22